MVKDGERGQNILDVCDVSKSYPGVVALKGASFSVARGTVHCIIGENGAGKSTLVKILMGAIQRTGGDIYLNSKDFSPRNTRDALMRGMSVIYQELNIVDELSVEQNMTLGKERNKLGVILRSDETGEMFQVLRGLEKSISIRQRVSELSVAKKQIVEIAKAISSNAEILIMDEATSALAENEVRRLFEIIGHLRSTGVTIIYITHRLKEVFEIGDCVSVLRDGEVIATKRVSDVKDTSELISMMIGKVIAEDYVPSQVDHGVKTLEVHGLSTSKLLKDISFEAYKGEILGFYGLVGSGKTEIARALYGADVTAAGRMAVSGRNMKARLPKQAVKRGLAMVPEERRSQGVFGELSIKDNITVMNTKDISRFGILNKRKEKSIAQRYKRELNVVAKGIDQLVSTLSGGNQQKVVIGKCLNADSKVLLMDEPTRGIDVGAKDEIHKIIRKLAGEGVSVLVFSSELPEIVNLCDRIILLFEGRIVRTIRNGELDSESIMRLVMGGT